MGIFSAIFGFMQAKPRKGQNPALYPLDYDELKEELGIVHEARRMAAMKSPSPDTKSLTAIEVRIVDKIEEYRSHVVEWAHDHLIYLQSRMSKLDITMAVNRARESAQEFKREANEIIAGYDQDLRELHATATRLDTELELFKSENRLIRQAKPAMTSISATISILFVILLIGLEGAANAKFFAASMDGGLIDGFFFAGALALINVVVNLFLAMYLFKFINHVKPLKQIAGALSMILAASMTLAIAMITTHLRDAFAKGLDIDNGETARMALQSMLDSPFAFHEMYSLILFLVSIIFACMSMAKGYFWGDKYPGYSAVTGRVAEAWLLYESKVEMVRDDLKEAKNKYADTLDEVIEASKQAIVNYKKHIQDKQNTAQRMSTYMSKAEFNLASLIELFRGENTLHRKDLPRPVYFDASVPVKDISPPKIDTSLDEQELARQEAHFSELLRNVEPIRGEIQSSFVQCYDQLTPIREHLQSA